MISLSNHWKTFVCAALLAAGCGGSQKDATDPSEAQTQPPAEPVTQDPVEAAPPPSTPPQDQAQVTPPAEIAPPAPAGMTATAELAPAKGQKAAGQVKFEEVDGKIQVTGTFTGLKKGMRGLTVHDATECGKKDGGPHFNPSKQKHGDVGSATRHTGDFGNIDADADGNASFSMTTDSFTLKEGPDSVVGKIIAIHANKDDGKTQPGGKSGNVIACGTITAAGGAAPVSSAK